MLRILQTKWLVLLNLDFKGLLNMEKILNHRTIRLCYLARENKFVDADRLLLENKLRAVAELDVVALDSLQDPDLLPCDLLVVHVGAVEKENFQVWLGGFRRQIERQAGILIPVLLVTKDSIDIDLSLIFADAVKANWYFDIVSLKELDTLPIRMANLLRIHDHLHELKRYTELLEELKSSVAKLQKKAGQ